MLLVCRNEVDYNNLLRLFGLENSEVVNDKVALAEFLPEYMPKQTLVHNALDCVAFAI